ncbi:hypothetical protein BsWGS_20527 [Bradybaena similaris]
MWAYLTGLVLICVVSQCRGYGAPAQTGEIDCGSSDNWANVTSSDPSKDNARENAQIVTFDTKFCKRPEMIVTVSYLDVPYDKNVRYNTILYSANRSQFKVSCYTWGDSIVHGMKVRWLAFGV